MTVAKWQPSHLYAPSDIVAPVRTPAPTPTPLVDPDFQLGGGAWTLGAGFVIDVGTSFSGLNSARHAGIGTSRVSNAQIAPCDAGKVIKASAIVNAGGALSGVNKACVAISFLDAGMVELKLVKGEIVLSGVPGWDRSELEAEAPNGTAYVRLVGLAEALDAAPMWFDNFVWDYAERAFPLGIVYQATQPGAATSSGTEPLWPVVLAGTVVDGGVTWTAISTSRVTWEAEYVLKSGAVPPAWPTRPGQLVGDGTLAWEAITLEVTDSKLPHTNRAVIGASKIFKVDGDLIRYCATIAPLDWSSPKDAGYFDFGLNSGGANHVQLLGLYRKNLIAMSSTSFKQYQIDPDPALMGEIDGLEGIGSEEHWSGQSVVNDYFYCTSSGVRSIGMSAATNNLQAGDIGMPVDPLVRAALDYYEAHPISLFFPGAGQYWLIFSEPPGDGVPYGASQIFVFTLNQVGQVGAWSRYLYPFQITQAQQRGTEVLVRSGDEVFELSYSIGTYDFFQDSRQQVFDGVIQWGWLDMESPGIDKSIDCFDIVGYGAVEVSFGYNQKDVNQFSVPYLCPADTLPGTPIPMPLTAPSFSVRLVYRGGQDWQFNAMNLYLEDGTP